MFHRILAWTGIAAIVIGFVMMVLPVARIPLLDANRQVLAESEREGYCAGETYITSRGMGDKRAAKDCRAHSTRSPEINLETTQAAFCSGLIANGFPITHSKCVTIMVSNRMWPTMDGSIANSWNRRFPYPGDMIITAKESDDGRVGSRSNTEREDVPFR